MHADEGLLKLILEGDKALSKGMHILVPDHWTTFSTAAFSYTLERIQENADSQFWWTYLPIAIDTNTLLGSCGYKGPPNQKGIVEIGYEVARDYRNKGLATEIVELLIAMAFKYPKVKMVQAYTLAKENASVNVLLKCNFKFDREFHNESDGKIWKWILKKEEHQIVVKYENQNGKS